MGTKIRSDYRGLNRELDRLSRMPTPTVVAALEETLAEAFTLADASVHIDTDSLRQSQKKSSNTTDDVWTGDLTFGGPSTGPKPNVDYAIYEKARGADHDFFRSQTLLHEKYIAAMKAGLGK